MARKIANIDDLDKYIKDWQETDYKNDNILVCEMIDAKMMEVNFCCSNGKIVGPVMTTEQLNLSHKFAEGLNIGSHINAFGSERQSRLAAEGKKIYEALGEMNGFYHCEVFERENGELVLLEVNPRRSGSLVNTMFQEYAGIDVESLDILCQWDYDIDVECQFFGKLCAYVEFPRREGTVREVKIPSLPSTRKEGVIPSDT
jgi:hypothetical protein